MEESDINGQPITDDISIPIPVDHQTQVQLSESSSMLETAQKKAHETINADFFTNYKRDSEDKTADIEEYKIRQNTTGKVIIVNIEKFKVNGVLREDLTRKLSSKDVEKLQETFKFMGMDVIVFKNGNGGEITANEFTELRKTLAEDTYKDYHMVILIVMSHGDKNKIHASNFEATIEISEITKTFENNLSLQNKPKLFIFQGCRGSKDNWIPNSANNSSTNEDSNVQKYIPKLADCLIIQSTIADYKSYRNEKGSWFIQTLCKVLMENWKTDEICTLLTRANCAMSQIISYFEHDKKKEKIKKQMSTFTSMLTKELYLYKRKIPENTELVKARRIDSKNLDFYNLNFPKRGKTIIINIDTFPNQRLKREESTEDVGEITQVFEKIMHMEVTTYPYDRETSADKIWEFIDEWAVEIYDDYAMFVLVFMSYGDGNSFYSSYHKLPINMNEIVEKFDNLQGLQRKPKIFIFQDCRSKKFPCSNERTSERSSMSPAMTEPHFADCIIIKSSPPAYLLYNKEKDAPNYINELCKVLTNYWMQEDIYRMLTRVNDVICAHEEKKPQSLTSSFKSMLRKQLCFSPEAVEYMKKANPLMKSSLQRFPKVLKLYWLNLVAITKQGLAFAYFYKDTPTESVWFERLKHSPVTKYMQGLPNIDIDLVLHEHSSPEEIKDFLIFTSILFSYSNNLLDIIDKYMQKDENFGQMKTVIMNVSNKIARLLANIPGSMTAYLKELDMLEDVMEILTDNMSFIFDDQKLASLTKSGTVVVYDVDILFSVLGLQKKSLQSVKHGKINMQRDETLINLVVNWLKDKKHHTSQTGDNNSPTSQTDDNNPPTSQTGDNNPPTSQTDDNNPPTSQTGDNNPPTSQTGDNNPPTSQTGDNNPPTSQTGDNNPPTSQTDDNNPPTSQTEDNNPPTSPTDDNNPPTSQIEDSNQLMPQTEAYSESKNRTATWNTDLISLGFTSWKAISITVNNDTYWNNHKSALDLAKANIIDMFNNHPVLNYASE